MLKRFLIILSSGFLKLTLLGLALAGAAWMVFGQPDTLKKALEESGVYDDVVSSALDSAKDAAREENSDLPVDDPGVEEAARKAFSPELLSGSSGSVIDGVYGWLSGKTAEPNFSIDLTEAKQRFADETGKYAQSRYEGLPACSLAQLQNLAPDADPFALECQPPGLTPAAVNEQVRSKILGADGFLKDTTFTADDLPAGEGGKTVVDNLAAAPDIFNLLRSLPWLLAGLSVLFAAGVLLLSEDKKRGLKIIGRTLLGTGVALLIGVLLVNWTFDNATQTGNQLETGLLDVIRVLSSEFSQALLRFYVPYIVLGAGILMTLWFRNRSNKPIEHSVEPSVPISEPPVKETVEEDQKKTKK